MLSIDTNVILDFLTNIARKCTCKRAIKCMEQDCILFIPIFFALVLVGLFYRLMCVLLFFFSTLHSKAKEKTWHQGEFSIVWSHIPLE